MKLGKSIKCPCLMKRWSPWISKPVNHQCGFGVWPDYQRRQAEEEVPELARLLKAIEIPHQKLHLSAIAIKEKFRPADPALGAFLQEKKIDHLSWMNQILLALHDRDQSNLGVETDPRQCSLGRWLHGSELAAKIGRQPELAALVKSLSSLPSTATSGCGNDQ
ncbi:MAG: CZB domain-containing protein [Desulfurivibrio sp.]|nr:CZB domain-containing protein [Desulfurivibrio sp.]